MIPVLFLTLLRIRGSTFLLLVRPWGLLGFPLLKRVTAEFKPSSRPPPSAHSVHSARISCTDHHSEGQAEGRREETIIILRGEFVLVKYSQFFQRGICWQVRSPRFHR